MKMKKLMTIGELMFGWGLFLAFSDAVILCYLLVFLGTIFVLISIFHESGDL